MGPKPAAPRSVPLTWDSDVLAATVVVRQAAARPSPPFAREALGYAIALGAVIVALAVTRLTWPLFSRTPFALLLAANFVAARYGNETAALLAILISAFGAGVAVPGDAPNTDSLAIVVLVSGSLVLNRVVVGRSRRRFEIAVGGR